MKVYVSSTFEDLQEHRRAVSVAIRNAGWEDVAMEYYIAEDKRAVDRCLEDVAACDLYIGVFAWRYGWTPPKRRFSITELEYRTAVALKKPRLLFLADPKAAWPPFLIDADRKKIEALRKKVGSDRIAGFFGTPDSLIGQLSPALARRIEIKPVAAQGIDTAAYVQYLRRRYGILDLDALMDPKRDELQQLRLENIFIEQRVKEDPPPLELTKDMLEVLKNRHEVHEDELPQGMTPELMSSYLGKPSTPVLSVLSAEDNRLTIVLGDPGAGKSTLLRYLLLSTTSNLPILIDLKTYTALRSRNQCQTFFDYFDRLHQEEGCPAAGAALRHHLEARRPALILFDGIDEIFEPEEQEKITKQIIAVAEAYPNARIVATSRIIGYRRTLLTNAGFRHYTLQDLDRDAIVAFTRRWYEMTLPSASDVDSRVQRIKSAYDASASIRQLAGNPMLLTIMAIIGKHQELPRARWNLYDHAASVLVQHWDVKKHLADKQLGAELMDDEDKKELLRRLAYAMQKGEGGLAGNYIHGAELHKLVEEYLRDRYQLPVERCVMIARAMIAQFRERNFILASYGANLYGFVHRAFLEFFCASAIVYRFEKTKELPLSELKEIFERHRKEKAWNEVLRLICGAIGESFAGDLIDQLRVAGDSSAMKLAVECLSEIRRIDAVADAAGRLLIAVLDFLNGSFRHDNREWQDRIEMASAAAAIGTRWPQRENLIAWLSDAKSEFGVLVWELGHVIGSVGNGLNDLRSLLFKTAKTMSSLGNAAIYALGAGWPDDSDVTDFLLRCTGGRKSIRLVAYQSLSYYRRSDERLANLIFARATPKEPLADLVVQYFHEDPRSVPFLMAAARKTWWTGETAVRGMETHIAQPRVRKLLQKLTSDDRVGTLAAQILARHPAPKSPASRFAGTSPRRAARSAAHARARD